MLTFWCNVLFDMCKVFFSCRNFVGEHVIGFAVIPLFLILLSYHKFAQVFCLFLQNVLKVLGHYRLEVGCYVVGFCFFQWMWLGNRVLHSELQLNRKE